MFILLLIFAVAIDNVVVVEAAATSDVVCNVDNHTLIISATEINLSWSVNEACKESSGLRYNVALTHLRYKSCKDRSQGGPPIQKKTNKTDLVLTDLKPYSDYFVKIEGLGVEPPKR